MFFCYDSFLFDSELYDIGVKNTVNVSSSTSSTSSSIVSILLLRLVSSNYLSSSFSSNVLVKEYSTNSNSVSTSSYNNNISILLSIVSNGINYSNSTIDFHLILASQVFGLGLSAGSTFLSKIAKVLSTNYSSLLSLCLASYFYNNARAIPIIEIVDAAKTILIEERSLSSSVLISDIETINPAIHSIVIGT